MYIKGLFSNPRFTGPLVVVGIFTALFMAVNIFVIGGVDFYNTVNYIVPAAAALVSSYLFFQAAANKKDSANHSLWLLMACGFGLWGLADSIYAYFFVAMGEELSTPSISDLFWVLAYIPLYLALIFRLRTLRVKPTRLQSWFIFGFGLCMVALPVVYVLLPVVRDYDPTRLLEMLVSLYYTFADAGLVILACLILVLLKAGRFSLIWRLVFGGILLMTLSDLLYYCASWQGWYMPDGQVNAISIISDTCYTLAYILAGVGMYIYRFIWNMEESFTFHIERLPAKQFYAFAGTDRENQVISVSNNFYYLVNGAAEADYYRRPLAEILGIRAKDWQALLHRIITNEMVSHTPVMIAPPNQPSKQIWITSVATYNPGREYIGANFVLAADISAPDELRLPNNQELASMVNHLLSQAGSRPQDEIQAIEVYCLELIRLLSSMLYQFGGDQLRDALFAELNRTTRQHNLPLSVDSQSIQFPDNQDGPSLARDIRPLLQSARDFVAGVIGIEMVSDEIQEMEDQLSATVKRDLDKYNLRSLAAA